MNNLVSLISVAVLAPVFGTFDYLPAEHVDLDAHTEGKRVLVPFGTRKLIGIVTHKKTTVSDTPAKLKRILHVYQHEAIVSPVLMELLQWSAAYYCHPLGDCLQAALPALLRKTAIDETAASESTTSARRAYSDWPKETSLTIWSRTDQPFTGRSNATQQQNILAIIAQASGGVEQTTLKALGIHSGQLKALEKAGLLRRVELDPLNATTTTLPNAPLIELNSEQSQAVFKLSDALGRFAVALLHGVTGSGKTEVYIKLVGQILQQGKQALILIPEINLTPQTLARFQTQLATPIGVLHSGISEREKFTTWSLAKRGLAKVIIGTRSAIFTPFLALGMIVVDEEHDSSYKQMDGFKYSARDLAVKRGQLENCTVLLGSATPSLESIYNARIGKYRLIKLGQRAGAAQHPKVNLIDIRSRTLEHGCSRPLLDQITAEIISGNQVIIFQNRRGFSPTLICSDCGWLALCPHCDSRLTVHSKPPHLHCHHCNHKRAVPNHCEHCKSRKLNPLGTGTERLEFGLAQHFPQTPIHRIDRDNIKSQAAMEQLIKIINRGEPCLLIGTQMLAKGHDFHNVTLVAIIDADASFFSADFRAIERSAQQLLQVAGRTGRGDKKGQVLIQTRHPEHPLFNHIIAGNYESIANIELEERASYKLPPFAKMISLRADSSIQNETFEALQALHDELITLLGAHSGLQVSGPIPANIARKANTYRSYLHLYIDSPRARSQILSLLPPLLQSRRSKHPKLAIDVDPLEYA